MKVINTMTLVLLLAAAGCTATTGDPSATGSPSDPAATASPAGSPGASPQVPARPGPNLAVIIRKTGGIAGVNETLSVDAQGSWTRVTRTGTRTGKLTAEQMGQLASLAADQRLASEALRSKGPGTCADGFNYAVTISSMTVSFTDCGDGSLPATTGLIRYLEQSTAG